MSNITFAPFPIPVVTPLGSGYIVYVSKNPIHENDEITVAMDEDGQYRHFNAGQVKAYKNATYGINAGPKESYEAEWFRKFNEGIGITNSGKPTTVTFSKGWTDALVAEYVGFYKSRKNAVSEWSNLPADFEQTTINEFKDKHNIK